MNTGVSTERSPLFPLPREEQRRRYPETTTPGLRITHQWQITLDSLIEGIKSLPAKTEQRFLKVGAMLQEISSRLRRVAEGADSSACIMSGEESHSVTSEMELLLDRLDQDFLSADRSADQAGSLLAGIVDELVHMERLMESFKGHVSNLRMLKLLTNIQVASLAQRGLSFRNVANDIGTLSQNIQGKSDVILSRIRTLNADLLKGRALVAGLGMTQRKLNRTMVEAVRTKISIMAEMHGNCSVAARDLSSRSGEISRNVDSIVVSLQFQDITRQQMEHAHEALSGLAGRIAGSSGVMLSDEMAGDFALQTAQIKNSADELVHAVKRIASSLEAVSTDAADSSARTHGLFQQTEGIGKSSLAAIELGLNSLVTAFTQNMKVSESLDDIILWTTVAMDEITGFAGEIDFLGSEIRLIALNAIIKAAQAGKEGAAFNVIAETIKHQSDDICRQAETINTTIRTITSHVVDLRQETLQEGDSTTRLRTEELAATVGRLKALIAGAGDLLHDTDQAALSLAETIDGAAAALGSRELVGTVQGDILTRLERLTAGLQSVTLKELQGRLADSARRYTMGSERAVHQKIVMGEAPESRSHEPGNILFGPQQDGNDHFDSNVELF